MKFLKGFLAIIDGKKRGLGGSLYVFFDVLELTGLIEPGASNQMKALAGTLFWAGVGHAVQKRMK